MFPASLSRSPLLWVLLTRSDPAKSTMESRETCTAFISYKKSLTASKNSAENRAYGVISPRFHDFYGKNTMRPTASLVGQCTKNSPIDLSQFYNGFSFLCSSNSNLSEICNVFAAVRVIFQG